MAKKSFKDAERVQPESIEQWRKWLEKNHTQAEGIWLVYYKKGSGKPYISYVELVEEALCFGWIDSLPNKLDEERTMLYFSPRKLKSVWSKLNKSRVEKLIAEGRMQPPGLYKIECAKQNGSYNTLDEIEELIMPEELQSAIKANPIAEQNFSKFPPSTRKAIFQIIISAKTLETKLKRVAEVVSLAEQNIRAYQSNQPKQKPQE